MSEWTRYYDAAGEEPRETLLFALERFERPGRAVDLGCGTGRDTVELLRRGWAVEAIDGEAVAIERLRGRDLGAAASRLTARVASFEDATWKEAELVNASWALPFCRPERFPPVWARIAESIPPGGRFSGQLFGDRDGWAAEEDMTFHSRPEAEALLSSFDVELFDEVEEDSQTAVGDPKHWHVFHVVARRP
jgi:SAM-dependent methyltransferase